MRVAKLAINQGMEVSVVLQGKEAAPPNQLRHPGYFLHSGIELVSY